VSGSEGHPSDPPGAVSQQNEEEAESGLRGDETHPEPRRRGEHDGGEQPRSSDEGASKEGKQSTGHPQNAG
jgi:hypothetical protein